MSPIPRFPRAWAWLGLLAFAAVGSTAPQAGGPAPGASDEADLRRAVERFIASADKADVAEVAATYDPEFACVRVADEGGFARLSREQMLGFFGRAVAAAKGEGAAKGAVAAHAIPTRETTIHHAEAIGDTGFVLLTRVKDLGKGWEPMFYTLVWKKHDGRWRLLREYVHQKSIPRRP